MKNIMNLTPEEKFYSEVWKLLEKIKEKYLATPKEQPPKPKNNLFYEPRKPHGVEIWLNYGSLFNQQRNIIYKLQEWKSLKVLDETRGDLNYEGTRFILKILQPRLNKVYQSWEKINENPWLSEENKIVQIKKVLKERQKQSKENKINFPTDPDVIEEYLDILNRIEKERQRTPKGEPIAFPIPKGVLIAKGVPLPEQETSILRIFEQDGIIKITEKEVDDPFDPYGRIIRAVKIPDLDKFKNYRDKLSEPKKQLGKSHKERKTDVEARAKEMRRQFEELDAKQKAFEELRRQISSRIQEDFNVKQYREVIKKIEKEVEPMRRALEQLATVYSDSVQNSLTPVLQRLRESIKPIGEQMKRLKPLSEYSEYPKEALISSDVIQARQGAETILKLENIETLLQGFLSKDKEKSFPKDIFIEPTKPYSNIMALKKILSACTDFIYWIDKHFQKEALEIIWDIADVNKIKEVVILSLSLEQTTNKSAKKSYKKLKKELNNKGIKLKWFIIDSKLIKDTHDRWILTKTIGWNLPNCNSIFSSQRSEIHETTKFKELIKIFKNYLKKASEIC